MLKLIIEVFLIISEDQFYSVVMFLSPSILLLSISCKRAKASCRFDQYDNFYKQDKHAMKL